MTASITISGIKDSNHSSAQNWSSRIQNP